MVSSQKRSISNKYYEYLFETYKKTNRSRRERMFINEAEERLKLFFTFQNTLKEVLEVHIDVKKLFIVPNKDSLFEKLEYQSKLKKEIEEKRQQVMKQVEQITPYLKQPELLKEFEYDQLMKTYLEELKQDELRINQIKYWEKEEKDKENLKMLLKEAHRLQRMNRGAIFILYTSKHNINKLLTRMQEETYAIENMIDGFKI